MSKKKVKKAIRKKRKLAKRKRKLSPKKRKQIEKIVNVHYEKIFNLVCRLVMNPEDAEEITQEVFLRFCDGRLTKIGGLYKSAINLALSHIKRSGLFAKYLGGKIASIEGQLLPPPEAHCKGFSDVVTKAVETLSVKLRHVVVLYYWEGLPVKAIAVRLNIKEGAVRTRLSRARAELKSSFAGVD